MKRLIPDVPDARLPLVIAVLKVDNPISITKEKQDNGFWTVIGEFPDNTVASNEAITRSELSSTTSTPHGASSNQLNIDASTSDGAIDTLARTLWGEARGETKAGKEAIASVILNRLKKPGRFGGTIEDVCRKPFQFSCWNDNDPNLPKLKKVNLNDSNFAECVSIAKVAVNGLLDDSTVGADHYHTTGVSPNWSQGKTPCVKIGTHLFFNNI